MIPKLKITSERSLLVRFSGGMNLTTLEQVQRLLNGLMDLDSQWIENLHPAYSSLLIEFDPEKISVDLLIKKINEILSSKVNAENKTPRTFEIPVHYTGEDLKALSKELSLSESKIIEIHSSKIYTVFFLGFQPGFPYLGTLPPSLHVPRLSSPRVKVPAGSVAIAGQQTGIYPEESPGGWRLLGRTPIVLFDPKRNLPATLQMGDHVRFYPITLEEFKKAWETR